MIIGCSGWIGSGKTEFALLAEREFGATTVAFADALREEVREFLEKHGTEYREEQLTTDKNSILKIRLDWTKPFSFPEMWFWTWFKVDSVHITPRLLLQLYGTEFRRHHFGDDYWVKKLHKRLINKPGLFIIDDVRFKTEANLVRKLYGDLIRINRWEQSPSEHESEKQLNDWKDWRYILNNHGSLEEYHEMCRMALEGML